MFGRFASAILLLSLMTPAVRAEPQTVRVQMVRTLAQAPYYIAVTNGYFEKEGLTIDSSNVRSALDTIAPLAMGQLDVGIGAATSGFFNAASRGFDMRIVAAMGYQGPVMSTQPLIRKALWDDGSVRSAKDFRGRKVAINAPGDITEYFFTLTARKYGMSIKDMNIVPLGFSEQLAAFKNGAIDAGSLPEPLSFQYKIHAGTARCRAGVSSRADPRCPGCSRILSAGSEDRGIHRPADKPQGRGGGKQHALCDRS